MSKNVTPRSTAARISEIISCLSGGTVAMAHAHAAQPDGRNFQIAFPKFALLHLQPLLTVIGTNLPACVPLSTAYRSFGKRNGLIKSDKKWSTALKNRLGGFPRAKTVKAGTMQLEMGSAPASGAVRRALAAHSYARNQPTV